MRNIVLFVCLLGVISKKFEFSLLTKKLHSREVVLCEECKCLEGEGEKFWACLWECKSSKLNNDEAINKETGIKARASDSIIPITLLDSCINSCYWEWFNYGRNYYSCLG